MTSGRVYLKKKKRKKGFELAAIDVPVVVAVMELAAMEKTVGRHSLALTDVQPYLSQYTRNFPVHTERQVQRIVLQKETRALEAISRPAPHQHSMSCAGDARAGA